MEIPAVPAGARIGKVDLEAYRDFARKHKEFYYNPRGNCMCITNYRFRFEIQWWSEKEKDISYMFAKFLYDEYGAIGECTHIQFSGKPVLKFKHDQYTGFTICTDNLAIIQCCLEGFCRVITEFYGAPAKPTGQVGCDLEEKQKELPNA